MCEEIPISFVGVTQRKKGRPIVLSVPGSNGTHYRVILRRNGKSISTECAQDIGALGHRKCKGNKRTKTLCRHSRALYILPMKFVMKKQQMKI